MTITSESRLRLRFLFLYYVIFASSFVMINGLACRPDQIQALLHFKNEFDSRGCNRSYYLNGVLCHNVTGLVTKIQLPSGCFTGILKPNSSLFKLHHLRYLNLSHNNFTSSSLPSEFSNLKRLEVLSLSSNGFTGQVPSSFSNLSFLSSLDLSHNELTGNFSLVKNLTKLDLSYNQFSGNIPSSLLTMPFLSYLDLRGNHLTDPIEVSNSSSSSSRLQHLFLGKNHFQGQILKPISKLITLKDLDLSFLNLSYPIDLRLFSSLKSLLNLELSGNIIVAESLYSDSNIPPKLYRLMLKNCNISEVPKILKNLQNLERLDLSNNRIKGKVPEWLWGLPRLSIVNLSNNSFNGFDGSEEILSDSSVTMLDFSLNDFAGLLPVPPLLIKLFSAWNNSFTGDIPLSICDRNSLTALDLSYNYFTGSVPQCLSKLTTVNLRKNNLHGSLPDIFYSNSMLETLDVGYNQISGKLPRSLMNCSLLTFLSVEHNKVKDKFPFWLKALPNLEVLTLRSNRFYGPISLPQGPLGFQKLRILELSDNRFTGSLSSDYFVNWSASSHKIHSDVQMYMGDYKNSLYQYFYTLDLRYKSLYMEHEKVLTFYAAIDFSANKLGGKIPESIGNLTALIALNLSDNSFTGQIPLSFACLTELESLDLSRNQLSGKIPQELGTLSFLAYINVSNNQLEGEIPKGTQISGQPKSSFEKNAGLCGLPLQETCFDTNEPQTQEEEHNDDKVEEVLNWKAVAIAYWPGVLIGLAIGHVIALYKPEWLVKIIGPDGCRNR